MKKSLTPNDQFLVASRDLVLSFLLSLCLFSPSFPFSHEVGSNSTIAEIAKEIVDALTYSRTRASVRAYCNALGIFIDVHSPSSHLPLLIIFFSSPSSHLLPYSPLR